MCGCNGARSWHFAIRAQEDDVAVTPAFEHWWIGNNGDVFKDLRHSLQLSFGDRQVVVIAAVSYVEASGSEGVVSRTEEFNRGEGIWRRVACKDVTDDDVAAGRDETVCNRAGLAGANLDGGRAGDVEKRTHKLAQLCIELDHCVP